RIMASLDNVLGEVVCSMEDKADAVNGCWQCHGSVLAVQTGADGATLKNEAGAVMLDPMTYPNSGVGRLNLDGYAGTCNACHGKHSFRASTARQPENCGKCHLGPDHPQMEIYNESKHGIAYYANVEKMALDNEKWIVGEDYSAAPTCATCHMSATKDQPVTHDVGLRISWNNRPAISIRPEVSDAKMGLPGKDIPWQERRGNMVNVCLSCHNQKFIDAFYAQYDGLIDLYHEKFAEPGMALMKAAKPLLREPEFSNKIDFVWFEIWHHEGRRARHGASMMGPDYTHWHGTYEVARNFYTELIPELRELAEHNLHSDDPARKEAAEKLNALLDETLKSENHRWYINQMPASEKQKRDAQRNEFINRYK
ncbi:MAG TPA: multiheme c-type cytochrome, partial [Oceanipulchritudo sp.]|nr:multiheme c-type cytochrome [Oceanipulchritudo sp.]